jgi:hypothetical protein
MFKEIVASDNLSVNQGSFTKSTRETIPKIALRLPTGSTSAPTRELFLYAKSGLSPRAFDSRNLSRFIWVF